MFSFRRTIGANSTRSSMKREFPMRPPPICAPQDRDDNAAPGDAERLVAADQRPRRPATGKHFRLRRSRHARTGHSRALRRCGLQLKPQASSVTTPSDFKPPVSGDGRGAVRADLARLAGFVPETGFGYEDSPAFTLAGGAGTHPGAGVPMAALSGRLAAQRLISDRASTRPVPPGRLSLVVSRRRQQRRTLRDQR